MLLGKGSRLSKAPQRQPCAVYRRSARNLIEPLVGVNGSCRRTNGESETRGVIAPWTDQPNGRFMRVLEPDKRDTGSRNNIILPASDLTLETWD